MNRELRPEDVIVETYASPAGEVSVRLTHTPTGVWFERRGIVGRTRDEAVADATAELAECVRRHRPGG